MTDVVTNVREDFMSLQERSAAAPQPHGSAVVACADSVKDKRSRANAIDPEPSLLACEFECLRKRAQIKRSA